VILAWLLACHRGPDPTERPGSGSPSPTPGDDTACGGTCAFDGCAEDQDDEEVDDEDACEDLAADYGCEAWEFTPSC
jgi:hypothetical protein